MQNYRLLFTENNTNDRYLILLNISALKCPDSDTVATDLQEITDHLAIYQSGREGIKMVLEHYKNTYPDLNYTICRMDESKIRRIQKKMLRKISDKLDAFPWIFFAGSYRCNE